MGRQKTAPGPLVLHQHQHAHQGQAAEPGTGAKQQQQHNQQLGYSASSSIPTLGETSQGLLLKAPGNIDRSLSPSSSPRSLYTSKFSPRLHDHTQFNSSAPSPAPSQKSFQEPSQEAVASRKDSPPSASPQPQPQANKAEQHPHNTHNNRQRQHPGPQDSPPFAAAAAIAHETKQPHIAELQQRLPPITRSLTASSTHQPPQSEHRHPVRRLKSTRGRRRDDAAPASQNKQGFFLNFHKSARSSDRLPLPSHAQGDPTTVAPSAASVRAAMNGTEQPPNAQQHPSKQAGKP